MNTQLAQQRQPRAMRHAALCVCQQSPEAFLVASIFGFNDVLDQTGERRLIAPQVSYQAAGLIECDRRSRLGDQSCRLSFLSRCWFIHGVPVGEGRSAGGPVPFPRRCDKCDTAEGWAFRQRASRSQAIAWAGCAAALWPRHRSQPRSTSPTGRWRSRRSPPPPIKSRLLPGLLQRFSLGSRCESPSPVPRSCRCAPGANRPQCATAKSACGAKRPTQRRRPHWGRPFLFMRSLPPRSRVDGWPARLRFRVQASAQRAGLP